VCAASTLRLFTIADVLKYEICRHLVIIAFISTNICVKCL